MSEHAAMRCIYVALEGVKAKIEKKKPFFSFVSLYYTITIDNDLNKKTNNKNKNGKHEVKVS